MKFTIPGRPVVLKRHRVSKWGGMFDPSVKDKKRIASYALVARVANRVGVLTGDIRVSVWFYGLRVNSDLDNAIKMMDAFNGVLWEDDRQIMEIHAYRSLIGEPRTEFEVDEI